MRAGAPTLHLRARSVRLWERTSQVRAGAASESARADFLQSERGRAPTIVFYKCIKQEGDGAAITSIAKEIEIGSLDSVDVDATKPACM